ncbi:MAG TPA: AraC family transcriptional regulator ligand-binding domain-containing protein [Chryseolinea sp.]|nr:AraC family transcriptional regulator ligand-binding domain-containing protein [Chryseolinea sp.]
MHAQMSILRDIIYGSVPYGADVDRVCAMLEINPHDLNDSERLVPFKAAAEVWDVVLAETHHPLLGLHLGEKISPAILGMIGYLMQSSRTLYEAIIQLAKFNDLHSTMMKYIIVEAHGQVEIQYHPATMWLHQYPESVRQSMELAMSGLVTLFRTISSRSVFPAKVEVFHPSRHVEEYERIFRAPILFNAGQYALTFRKSDLAFPIASFDKSLFTRFGDILEKKLQSLNAEEKFSDRIRQVILTEFKGNSPSVDSVAAHMNMTARSIQRRLKDERTTYREIAGRFKKELAEIVLTDPKFSASEVSTLLGYSDPSALRKALKRWSLNS